MATEEGLGALAHEIIESAREEAGEITHSAEARAAEAVRRAQEAAAAAREQVVSRARQGAARERARIESAAHLEARRRILARREAMIARVLEAARAQLENGLSARERREALEKVLLEAAAALDGGRLTVRASPQDAPFLTPELLQSLSGRLAARGIGVEFDPGPVAAILGGTIVTKDDGRVVIDNSFNARLERHAWELRNEVWQVLAEGVPEAVL